MRRKKKWSFLTSWLLVMAMVFSNASFVMAAEEDPNAPQAEAAAEEQQDSQIESESNEDKDAAVVEEAAPENEEQAEDAEPARGGAETEAVEDKAEQEIAPMAVEPNEEGDSSTIFEEGYECLTRNEGTLPKAFGETWGADDEYCTWVFEGQVQQIKLPDSALTDVEGDSVEWEVWKEYYDGEDKEHLGGSSDAIEISENEDYAEIKGKEGCAGQSVALHAHIMKGEKPVAFYAIVVDVREPRYDYYYPETEYLLPGDTYDISKDQYEFYIEDSNYPTGYGGVLEINDISVKSGEGVLNIEPWDDEGGWRLTAEGKGTAKVSLDIGNSPEEEKTYEITFVVGDKVYRIEKIVSDTNKHLMLPGGNMKLTAILSGSQYVASEDEEGDPYQDLDPADDGDAIIEWSISSYGDSEGETMPNLKFDKTVATVTADENIEYWSGVVTFSITNEKEDIALSEEFDIIVTQDYVMLKTESNGEINYNEWGIRPTEEITVTPELNSLNDESRSSITYEGYFDPNKLSVSIVGEGEGKVEEGSFEISENQKLKIKRLNTEYADFNIRAAWNVTEEGEELRKETRTWTNIWIPDFDCPIEFDRTNIDDERILMWNDEQQEDVQLTLTNTNSEALAGMKYSIEYDLGDWNWDEEKQEDVWTSYIKEGNENTYYTVDEGNNITLHKEGIFNNSDIIDNGGFQVKAVIKISDTEIGEDNMRVETCEPEYNYDFPLKETDSILSGQEWEIDATFHGYIRNCDYPDGQDFQEIEITKIDSSDTKVLPVPTKTEDDTLWKVTAGNPGTTTLTLYYSIKDPETGTVYIQEETKAFTINVKEDIYTIEYIDCENNVSGMLPDGSVTLRANIKHKYNGTDEYPIEEYGIKDGTSVKWYFDNEENTTKTENMTMHAGGDVCTVVANEGVKYGDEKVIVELEKDGQVLSKDYVDVWISDEICQWSLVNLEEDMQYNRIYAQQGDEIDLTSILTRYSTDGQEKVDVEPVLEVGWQSADWDDEEGEKRKLSIDKNNIIKIPKDEYYNGYELEVIVSAEVPVENSEDIENEETNYRIVICPHDSESLADMITPTCGTKPLTAQICQDCGYYPKGHPMIKVAEPEKKPTCGKEGSTEKRTCAVCGEELASPKVLPATGKHTWDQGTVTKQPTTTAEGVKTYTCTVCGEERTETIPKAAVTPDTAASGTAVGTTVTQNDVSYTVTATDTTEYKGTTNKKAKSATVPATVVINGKTYRVTSIAPNAFKKNKKLKKVKIGSNIETIGKAAFQNCTALKSVTIPKSVKRIDASAFSGCKNLKKIVIKSTQLTNKNVAKKAFAKVSKKAVVKVPAKKLKAYKKLFKKKGLPSRAKVKK